MPPEKIVIGKAFVHVFATVFGVIVQCPSGKHSLRNGNKPLLISADIVMHP